MLLRRIVVMLLLAMVAVPAALMTAPVMAAAQSADDEESFQSYLAQTDGVLPVAGPLDGALAVEGGPGNSASLGVDLADLLVQVDFEVPDVPADSTWAASVAFRQTSEGFHYLVLWPDGTWSFAPSGGGSVAHGSGVSVGPAGSTIALTIAAVGDTAYVGVNGAFLTTLDLSSSLDPGDVTISANLIGNADPGASMSYTNFAAWELQEGAGTPTAATETPEAVETATLEATATATTEPSPTESPTTAATIEPTATEAAATATTEPSPTESPTTVATIEPTATEAAATVEATETATPEPTTAAVQATAVGPTGDDESIFNSYLQQSLSSPIIFGPEIGTVSHEPDAVSFFPTGVQAADFIARVECVAGRAASEGFWDCGFVFRGGSGEHYRLVYVSDGYWFLSQGAEQPLVSGTDGPVSPAATDKVVLNLIAVGDTGYFGLNDEYIATLDLSAITSAGGIDLASAFFTDTYIEGGGVGFEDFIVWSLDDGTVQASPTTSTGIEASPTVESGTATVPAETTPATVETPTTGFTGVTGTTYASPTYGYSLGWSPEWIVENSSSDGSTDMLGLSNGPVIVDLIGEPWDAANGSCFDRLVQYYQGNADYSDVQSAIDSSSVAPGVWDITGIVTMTYTNEEGVATPYVNYAACSAIPGQSAIVSLEQFVPITDFRNHVEAMDALRSGFAIAGGSVIPAETASPEATVANPTPTSGAVVPTATPGTDVGETPTTTAAETGSVVGNTYTSPTFGYSLTWDDNWSVVAEQSSEGVDFLRIGTDTLTADLYAAASSNTPQQCIDELFNYYVNDELYENVAFASGPDGQPIVEDFGTYAHALISYTQTLENGETIDQFSEATCYRMEEQGAVVILEVYMPPADFVLQRGVISSLQEGLIISGQPAVQSTETAQTPVAEGTSESGTTVAPPEVEVAESATFFLRPVNASGLQGTGTVEAQPRMVIVTAIVIGGQPGDIVTIQRGDCTTIGSGAEPDYIVGELDDSGLLRAELQVRLAALLVNETYSVVVYPSGDEFTQALACGEIG